MSNRNSVYFRRGWAPVFAILVLWGCGIALRTIGVTMESVTTSHLASMALFTPFVAFCFYAASDPNVTGFRFSELTIGLILSAASFLVWNGVMLGITRESVPDFWLTVQSNAIHWITFFCCAAITLKCLRWILPIGQYGGENTIRQTQFRVSDLLSGTLVVALLLATLCIAFRSFECAIACSSVASAIRGGILVSLFFAVVVVAGQSRKNKVTWLVLILIACTALRYISPWLDQKIIECIDLQTFTPIVAAQRLERSVLASFVESIAQVGLLVMMADTLKRRQCDRCFDEPRHPHTIRHQEASL